LIHGIWDTNAIFNPMTAYLSQHGFRVYSLDLIPNNGSVGLDLLAVQLADFIDNSFDPEQPLDLIGFSMGGLVSRYYVQRLRGIDRVQRFITVSSPHHGTLTAYSFWLPGYVQMRPGSNFLRDLNQDAAMLQHINFTSIWTPYDAMIVPASSSQMPICREIKQNVLLHHLMITDPKILSAVVAELEAPIKELKTETLVGGNTQK
ncbi:MAG TPA: alpha/beta fold hydrolase, partial [Kamptonema sp.]|nr:alpha/beta fold hydrolase [Kamptonema sp.]